eukprot:TRINITY_DN35770_c0_g1_i1.p2 TRINITY_DN35770_c0_g1~~TRINITY_DN35770_c0_g1_i1.p2  ORF type:complete len:121 (+),score=28.94 TRINITY_DN35770_c0_g1_i1:1078-1440(+)
MAAVATDEAVDLKFRLADGSDIGPITFGPAASVQELKQSIIAKWPAGKSGCPKSVNAIKLINAGKVLENGRTLAESRVTVAEVPGGVITMHVVIRPPGAEKGEGEQTSDGVKAGCSCVIL